MSGELVEGRAGSPAAAGRLTPPRMCATRQHRAGFSLLRIGDVWDPISLRAPCLGRLAEGSACRHSQAGRLRQRSIKCSARTPS